MTTQLQHKRYNWYKCNGHYTAAYEQHILLSLVHSTIADISIKEAISEQAIQLIVDKSITDKINWKGMKRLDVIGIDDISLKIRLQRFYIFGNLRR